VKVVTHSGSQWGTVTTSSGYLSASDPRLHFGLGSDAQIERIEIRWPSGIQQIIQNPKVDQQVVIDEPVQTQSAKPVAAADTAKP
jgi:hypothetical protein